MKIRDIIKISQKNLLRAKLRTSLTIAAVFIGALTLSLTNGVGNGIKAYVNTQLGNVGAEDTLIVQAKQTQQNPTETDLTEYNPDKQVGTFNIALLSPKDIETLTATAGVMKATPMYIVQLEYISTGEKKYEAVASQYIEGLNLEMVAGRTVDSNSTDEITIPKHYIEEGKEQDVLNKYVVLAFKNPQGAIIEKSVKIVGVQQQSLLGNSGLNISSALAEEIHRDQTEGVPTLADSFQAAIVKYDTSYTDAQVQELKTTLGDKNYDAMTIKDQVGIIITVIDSILIVLNVFGVITLLAAAFGIINTLLMSVNERTSEIGLMKALGTNRKTIFSIFAIEAASIGFWGSLFGVLLSIAIGTITNNISSQTFLKDFAGFDLLAFPIMPALGVLFGIILLAFLAGALPSLKASKLDPIKALRYE